MFVGARADVYKQLAGVTQYPSTEGYIPTNNPTKRPDKYFQDIPEKHNYKPFLFKSHLQLLKGHVTCQVYFVIMAIDRIHYLF